MGADVFMTTSTGWCARDAFTNARQDALDDYGHLGYTGSIAEKHDFITIPLKEGYQPYEYAEELIDNCDRRIHDKWGPAGCIVLGRGKYFFFGWASC